MQRLICSKCSPATQFRENSCSNCNNELTWRRNIYTKCYNCNDFKEYFYYCVFCDYFICLSCSNMPYNVCGGMHPIEEIDKNKVNNIYCYNFLIRYDGKCCYCNINNIENQIWGCLRCCLFLCENCKIK